MAARVRRHPGARDPRQRSAAAAGPQDPAQLLLLRRLRPRDPEEDPGRAAGRVVDRRAGRSDPRWVGSGWTIFNNKGKPVRQYEPFFSATHRFEFGVQVGVSPVLFYDPVERVVATLHPNHTYEKVVFDPWRQTTCDVNDTVAANGTRDRRSAHRCGHRRATSRSTSRRSPTTWQTWHAAAHRRRARRRRSRARPRRPPPTPTRPPSPTSTRWAAPS